MSGNILLYDFKMKLMYFPHANIPNIYILRGESKIGIEEINRLRLAAKNYKAVSLVTILNLVMAGLL